MTAELFRYIQQSFALPAASQAALQGDKSKAGSIARVSAAALEALVIEALGKPPLSGASLTGIRDQIDRVTIGRAAIEVQLSDTAEAEADARMLTLSWTPPSPYRKREIIQGVANGKTSARPMRSNARAILLDALGDAHRWLDELLSDPLQTLASLASQEGKTDRSIRMTLSLAFLAPDIVKAAVGGRLPRGFGLKNVLSTFRWPGQTNGGRSGSSCRRTHRYDQASVRPRRLDGWGSSTHVAGLSERPPIGSLETGNLPPILDATRRERSSQPGNPAAETGSIRTGRGNLGLFFDPGNHVGSCRLLRGADEGIQTREPSADGFANVRHFPSGKQMRLEFPVQLNLADFVEERTGFPFETEREWRGRRPTLPPTNSLPRRPR